MFRLLSIIVSPISRRLHDTCDEVSSLLSTQCVTQNIVCVPDLQQPYSVSRWKPNQGDQSTGGVGALSVCRLSVSSLMIIMSELAMWIIVSHYRCLNSSGYFCR